MHSLATSLASMDYRMMMTLRKIPVVSTWEIGTSTAINNWRDYRWFFKSGSFQILFSRPLAFELRRCLLLGIGELPDLLPGLDECFTGAGIKAIAGQIGRFLVEFT
jgi:hypothetical protein